MPPNLPEPDWKTLSQLKLLALDRLCERILREANGIIAHANTGEHHRAYLDLYRQIQKNNEVVANCFSQWRRSQALRILINWRAADLLTEEEFATFSDGTRRMVDGFLKR